jgi:hypothetical protein
LLLPSRGFPQRPKAQISRTIEGPSVWIRITKKVSTAVKLTLVSGIYVDSSHLKREIISTMKTRKFGSKAAVTWLRAVSMMI